MSSYYHLKPPHKSKVQLLRVVFEDISSSELTASKPHERVVFVYYKDDDYIWVHETLMNKLAKTSMTITTEEQFVPGADWIKEIQQAVESSDFTILVLSKPFINDFKFIWVTEHAYTQCPQGLVPIALDDFDARGLADSHDILGQLVETNGLIQWSDNLAERETFWTELEKRLNIEQIDSESLKKVVTEIYQAASPVPIDESNSGVFVFHHENDRDWANDELVTFIRDKLDWSVRCEDDVSPGSVWATETLQSIRTREFTVVVLSASFINDKKYVHLLAQAFISRPRALIAVALPGVTDDMLTNEHAFISELSEVNGLLPWSEVKINQELFWVKLSNRLSRIQVNTEDISDKPSGVDSELNCCSLETQKVVK